MPVVGGRTLSVDELLSYIRLNINSLVDTRIAEFSPYDDGEAAVWKSGSPLRGRIGSRSCGSRRSQDVPAGPQL
ncbi:hypothetical protein AB4Z46_26465 [Variovorax sp. M-6]|uniref:hypothetical protein n=1 Tax=Variovorax sp. M-6 TaxID=3233041 RepID=UPI003F95AF30